MSVDLERAGEKSVGKPAHVSFITEGVVGGEIYPVVIHIWTPDEVVKPTPERNVTFRDNPQMTPQEIREVNSEKALSINILFNSYGAHESVCFFPDSQKQALAFSSWLGKNRMLGTVKDSTGQYSTHDSTHLTLPDFFFYEYSGTGWEQRPTFTNEWSGFLRRSKVPVDGKPCRDDMYISINRGPDYRVPLEAVQTYVNATPLDRANLFIDSLKKYSQDELRVQEITAQTPIGDLQGK